MHAPGLLSDADISRRAAYWYIDASVLGRVLQRGRPYICPFTPLYEHIPERSSLLDIGCGRGLFILGAAAQGRVRRAIGIDQSEAVLNDARHAARRLVEAAPELDGALVFSAVSSPAAWPTCTFEAVSLIDVLHHIAPAERRQFLTEAAQRVEPGGVLIYKDMCDHPWWRAAANRLHDLLVARQWADYLPLEQAQAWLNEAGLVLRTRQSLDRYCYGHELLVLYRPH